MLKDLRELLVGFPGESEVLIELSTSTGQRKLRLGSDFRVGRSAALHAELEELLGAAIVREAGAAGAAPGGAAPEEPEHVSGFEADDDAAEGSGQSAPAPAAATA